MGDLQAKFESFGWNVFTMYGNDMTVVVDTIKKAQWYTGLAQPLAILMTTHMGFGVDFMMDNHEWHGVFPNDEQTKSALAQLNETLGDY